MNLYSPTSSSFAARYNLIDDEKSRAIAEVLARLEAENIETVRVSFVDQHGVMRGKTLTAKGLAASFESGVSMTSTLLLKDTSHTTVFPIWQEGGQGADHMKGAADFLMLPDPATFRILPWAPHSAWILSDLYFTDGTPIPYATRQIAKTAIAALETAGYSFITGLEVEFYVLEITDDKLDHAASGRPEDPPQTRLLSHGYQYLTEQRYDQLEPVMDLIRRNAEQLGLPVRSMETEFGPSQFEFTFDAGPGISNGDAMILFRTMVKEVCGRQGLHATFMCRPKFKNAMASGWHLHQSLIHRETGRNAFTPEADGALSETGQHWLAGLLAHGRESCLLSTPTVNGYKRYQPFSLAPDRIQWGLDNRGAMLRVISSAYDGSSRIENRVGEPAANPYLYFASQIYSGLDGLAQKRAAPPPSNSPYDTEAERLPTNLGEAISAFSDSAFYREKLGDGFVDYYSHIKKSEWERYLAAVSDWEQREYFSLL